MYPTVMSVRTCQRWFQIFRSADFSLHDIPRSGRPFYVDKVQLRAVVEYNPQQTLDEIEGTSSMTVFKQASKRKSHDSFPALWERKTGLENCFRIL